MIIDLLKIWKEPLIQKRIAMIPEKPESYSDGVPVSTFDLPENVKIVFVKNRELMPVLKYDNLPKVELTAKEQAIVDATSEQIKPPYFDGDHIFVSSVQYDTDKKELYIEAKKGKYSLLMSLNRNKFPCDSPILAQDLYGTGAITPLITTDGKTVLLQSIKINNPFSATGGYVQPKNADTKLVDTENGLSLIETTARDELMEELLCNDNMEARIDVKKFTLSTISFRKPQGGRGFVEFFIAAELNCTHPMLENIIKTNVAPDRHEFTGKYAFFNLYADERIDTYAEWSKNHPAGRDLYPTAIRVASRIFNQFLHGDTTQQCMPAARIESFPISFFKPEIPKLRFTQEAKQSEQSGLTSSIR